MLAGCGSWLSAVSAAASVTTTTCLWTVGWFATPPPWLLRGVLGAAFLTGVLWIASAGPQPRTRRLGRLGGALSLAVAALFLTVLFRNADGPVEIDRRVDLPGEAPAELRLLSFNVLHGYPSSRGLDQDRRSRLLADALRRLDPAVVVLQEAWSFTGRVGLAEYLGRELGYDVAYAAANGSRRLIGFEEGSAILSRLPILDARRVELAPRRTPWRIRIALVATLEPAPGERLTVIGTHLANNALDVAAAQSGSLTSLLPAEGPVWVAGDLNAPSDSAAVRALVDRGLVDVLPGGIDHVLVSSGGTESGGWIVREARWTLRPQDLRRLIGKDERLSDHPAILVDFVRRPPAAPRRPAPAA